MTSQPLQQPNAIWSADLPSRESPLTEDDMQQMASNTEHGLAMIKTALDRQQLGFIVSEKVIKAAASNERYAVEILELLMKNGGSEVAITTDIVCAAAGNSLSAVGYLFQLPGRSFPTLENSLLAAVSFEDNRAAKMCASIVKQFPEAQISSRVLEAACTKFKVMQVLLDQPCDHLPIQEIIRKIARGNYDEAQVVQLLLDRKHLVVDEWAMGTLAANGSAFEIIITSQPDAPVTHNVLLQAASNDESMDILLENRLDDVVITEEVMIVAAKSDYTVAAILQNTQSVPITKKVFKEAAFHEQPDSLNAFLSLQPDLDPLAIWDEIWQDVDISAERKYRATRAIYHNADLEVTASKLQSYPYDPEQKNNYGLDDVVMEIVEDDRILPITEETTEIILERCHNKAIKEILEYNPDMLITAKLFQAAERNLIADKESLLSFLAEKRG
ncbi:uncharacterized protein ACHE_80460S [Aspergillus chevalieri]|uniref:Uncharacterized protein n=1 Tax=Aspergillus chevalieri TaxID=182096 RepID=A0A7R7VXK3_ASPCH|nr:uncharacterized protein ACHE_80460S [Aspergillus chevalieri]BCR92560.1 hypothetical protein ACHE_80460S [Aspergillus chevalieri]